MPALNWSHIREITRAEAKQSLLDLLDSVGFTATSWQPFSIPAVCVELSAEVWNYASQVAVVLKTALFNDTAEGATLHKFSKSHYDNEPELAVACQRLIVLSCAVGEGPHTINVGDIVVTSEGDELGQTFRNIEGNGIVYPINLTAGTSTDPILFEAEVAGEAANLADGEVDTLQTTLAGVTITSDTLDREGVDEESDPRLRARNSSKWSLLTQFEIIDDAVEAIALNASPTVAQVAVDSTNPRGAGTFDVYIAGELETAGVTDVDAVQDAIDPLVFGTGNEDIPTAVVIAAPELELDLEGFVYFQNATQADVEQAVLEVALPDFITTIPLGGFNFAPGPENKVTKNEIEQAIKGALVGGVLVVKTVVLATPAADLAVPSFNKVVRGDWSGLTFVAIDG